MRGARILTIISAMSRLMCRSATLRRPVGYSVQQCLVVISLVCVSTAQGLSLYGRFNPLQERLDPDSFPGQPGDGIPLFMKLLLWDSQVGSLFRDYRQPVLPPSPATPSSEYRKSLAKSVAPTSMSVDPAGTIQLEFPPQDRRAELESWLVLAPRRGRLQHQLTLAVFDISASHTHGHRHHADRRRLLSEDVLPNATFVAVDVTQAVRREHPDAPLRLLVDVTGGSPGSDRAADVLEVAGVERGPLLLRSREALSEDGSMRVWKEMPDELTHVPKRRERRHSKHPAAATADGFSSAESPVKKAATDRFQGDARPDDNNSDGGCKNCQLQSFNVSVTDLKWDFLVYPDELPINLCVGVCPSPLIYNYYNMTTNAIARSVIKSEGLYRGSDVPTPSCVPIRFTPFNVLIKNSGHRETISLEVINDLSAERCGCR